MKAPKRRTERQDTHTHTWELMSCHFIKPTATPRVLTPLQSSLSAVIAPSWPALSRHPPNAAFTSLGHFLNIQLSSHMICAQLSKSSNWELFFLLFLTYLVLLTFMSETKESEGTTHTIYEIIFFQYWCAVECEFRSRKNLNSWEFRH